MILVYTLTFPRANTWNGKVAGEEKLYAFVRSYRGQKASAKAQQILDHAPYSYHWDDGWIARIDVREVESTEAAKVRRKTAGFMGYEWMLTSIERYGKPLAEHEIPERKENS